MGHISEPDPARQTWAAAAGVFEAQDHDVIAALMKAGRVEGYDGNTLIISYPAAVLTSRIRGIRHTIVAEIRKSGVFLDVVFFTRDV